MVFLGFKDADWCPVQEWFDALPLDHQDEIVSLLNILGNRPPGLWRRPEFDRLAGAGGISEIRMDDDIRDERGSYSYRIYGYFGPSNDQYTFLHAIDKNLSKERNDHEGKRIARERLGQVGHGATVHRFDFESGNLGPIAKGAEGKS